MDGEKEPYVCLGNHNTLQGIAAWKRPVSLEPEPFMMFWGLDPFMMF